MCFSFNWIPYLYSRIQIDKLCITNAYSTMLNPYKMHCMPTEARKLFNWPSFFILILLRIEIDILIHISILWIWSTIDSKQYLSFVQTYSFYENLSYRIISSIRYLIFWITLSMNILLQYTVYILCSFCSAFSSSDLKTLLSHRSLNKCKWSCRDCQ